MIPFACVSSRPDHLVELESSEWNHQGLVSELLSSTDQPIEMDAAREAIERLGRLFRSVRPAF